MIVQIACLTLAIGLVASNSPGALDSYACLQPECNATDSADCCRDKDRQFRFYFISWNNPGQYGCYCSVYRDFVRVHQEYDCLKPQCEDKKSKDCCHGDDEQLIFAIDYTDRPGIIKCTCNYYTEMSKPYPCTSDPNKCDMRSADAKLGNQCCEYFMETPSMVNGSCQCS